MVTVTGAIQQPQELIELQQCLIQHLVQEGCLIKRELSELRNLLKDLVMTIQNHLCTKTLHELHGMGN